MTVGSEPLRYWIDMTLECVRRDHTNTPCSMLSVGDQRGPFLSARAVGLSLGALHDAHALASGRPPLLAIAASPGLAGADPTVAAAAACHQLLLLRYPKQARMLTPAWRNWGKLHAGAGGGGAEMAGRLFGSAVHAFGIGDPMHAMTDKYTPTGQDYTHDVPPNEPGQRFAGANWGKASPLVATRVASPPPPGRVSAVQVEPTPHFQADFDKVAAKGIDQRGAGTRTYEEELVGIYWGYDGPPELGTPPRLYLQVVLGVLDAVEAAKRGALSTAEELQVIAGVGIALADAGVDAWHYKYSPEHMMWRPVLGIRRAVTGNGTAIPGWLPLGRPDTNGLGQTLTPDFPAYPSGHATFGAAAFQLLRLFLVHKGLAKFDPQGVDNVDFDFVSDEYDGCNTDPRTQLPRELVTRRHSSLWQAIVDNSVSRVYLGVHWQFDGITTKTAAEPDGGFGVPATPDQVGRIGGVWLGAQIGNQIAARIGVGTGVIDKSRLA